MTSKSPNRTPRRKNAFPGSLTDLHRYRTIHGHDGSSRIVMVRKTDRRTIASIEKGQEPKIETITRETIETFRGQRSECKFTTEKKSEDVEPFPAELIEALAVRSRNGTLRRSSTPKKRLSSRMEFQKECLRAHNELREKHGVPPLKLNKEICKLSQEWADTLSRRRTLEHSRNNDYGENIYCVTSTDPNISITGDTPVKSWYDEIKLHKFDVEPKTLESGHFTQVIWKDSRELGVGIGKVDGRIVVVANYFPAGNIVGRFKDNVPPLGGFKETNNNNSGDPSEKLAKLSLVSKLKDTFGGASKANGTQGDFEEDFLNAHNEYRSRHGVPPLKLDKKLCKYATEWAKNLAERNTLEHRKNSPHGENIYCMYSSDPNFTITGHSPVDAWYEEIKYHPFGKEPNNLKSGHFTQVVWKSSELLGVGVAKSKQGKIYVVANYSPAGNFVGDYVENVPPLISGGTPTTSTRSVSPMTSRSPSEKMSSKAAVDPSQFASEGLKAHNEYRRKHGVPDLVLNKELCAFAQDWADQCARNAAMSHRPNNPYGENIFYAYSSDYSHVPTARDAVKQWYDEIREYKFGTEKVPNGTLHFTQVVWKATKELGMALAKNDKGESYVVANYSPMGNYMGQFVENVPRPKW